MIKAQDIVESIADAFQFISYYHPKDFIDAVFTAYKKEQSVNYKEMFYQMKSELEKEKNEFKFWELLILIS